jgi:hypothetical protein
MAPWDNCPAMPEIPLETKECCMRRQTRRQKLAMMLVVLLMAAGLSLAASAQQAPDPGRLWTHITKSSPYTQWDHWPGHVGMQPGKSPHGELHRVFVNQQALSSSAPAASYGSIVVKENYDAEKQLTALTVMFKVKDFNPKHGDWFWTKFAPDGTVLAEGKPGPCISCHSAAADNDFIFLHVL